MKARIWSVADFAKHAGLSQRRAKRWLLRLNKKHEGKILVPSEGTLRAYEFFPAALSRLEPDLFAPVESLEFRLDAVEESIADLTVKQRSTIMQTAANTHEITKLRSSRAKTASK